MCVTWANGMMLQLKVEIIPQNFERTKPVQWFHRYLFWAMGKPILVNGQVTLKVHNCRFRWSPRTSDEKICPAITEKCILKIVDPAFSRFDMFLVPGKAHMGKMGKWLWCCTTTDLRQFYRTPNGVNPPCGFRGIVSAKSGLQWYQIWQSLGPWTNTYMEMDKRLGCCTPTCLDNCIQLRMEKIHHAVSEIWVPQSLEPPVTIFDTFLAHGQTHMSQGVNYHNIAQLHV